VGGVVSWVGWCGWGGVRFGGVSMYVFYEDQSDSHIRTHTHIHRHRHGHIYNG
jgi:hypothetical protein